MSATVATKESAGFPMHLVGPDGGILLSFGQLNPNFRMGQLPDTRRLAYREGQLFSVPVLREYRIEIWTLAGELTKVLLPSAGWFPKYESVSPITPENPPVPSVAGIWLDQSGLLWVFTRIPSKDWRRYIGPVQAGEGGSVQSSILDLEKLEDTMIEVFDPAKGVLLASERLLKRVSFVTQDGRAVILKTLPSGLISSELWEMSLTRN